MAFAVQTSPLSQERQRNEGGRGAQTPEPHVPAAQLPAAPVSLVPGAHLAAEAPPSRPVPRSGLPRGSWPLCFGTAWLSHVFVIREMDRVH